jgi:protein involved in polysaccharide export with SLBB domain
MQTTHRAPFGLLCGLVAILTAGLVIAETTDDYVLGPGDQIAITVFDHPELSLAGVRVRPDGLITHPFLGVVKVGGQTASQLVAQLTKQLKKELRDPLVTVSVLEMAGGVIYVKGEVAAPGSFPTQTPLTVARAVNLALGLTPKANRHEAYIVSPQGDIRKVDLNLALGEQAGEYVVAPRETLLIPPVEVKPIMVIGEVEKPGKYGVAAPDDTVLNALLGCGWVTPNADRKYALLLRGDAAPQHVDIAPILQYQPGATGPHLQADDTLVFPRAVNYVTVWGAVARPGKLMLGWDEEHVSDMVVGAGGFGADADTDHGTLLRASGESVTVDLKACMDNPTAPANLPVQAGDTLLVATRRNEVILLGAVAKAGPQPFTQGETLLDLLTRAGGLAPNGDQDNVALLRPGEKPVTVSVRALLKDGDLTNNLALQVGDTVVVPEVKREVYVFGYVMNPGKFEFQEGDRLLDVIARAGIDKGAAATWETALIRKKGVNADVYLIDLDKVIRGLAPDKNYPIENGDVIVVPKRKGTNWLEWAQQLLSIYGLITIFR